VATNTLIGTTTTVAPGELNTYHRNPRRGDTTAIAASLQANSQYRPIVVNIGSVTGQDRIGNSVMPPMAYRIALAVREGVLDHIADLPNVRLKTPK
jgi:hypothetical protein